jgi:hypothetical protein
MLPISAFSAVPAAIALTFFTPLVFELARPAQALAIRGATSTFGPVSTAISFPLFTAFVLELAGAAQALTISSAPVLSLLYEGRLAGDSRRIESRSFCHPRKTENP